MTEKDKEINELRRLRAHGHWTKPNTRPKTTQAKCNICDRISYNNRLKEPYKFCPWCGAMMDE